MAWPPTPLAIEDTVSKAAPNEYHDLTRNGKREDSEELHDRTKSKKREVMLGIA